MYYVTLEQASLSCPRQYLIISIIQPCLIHPCAYSLGQTVHYLVKIVENILVRINNCFISVEFVVLDVEVHTKMSLILGRLFFSIANAHIDVRGGEFNSPLVNTQRNSHSTHELSNAHMYRSRILEMVLGNTLCLTNFSVQFQCHRTQPMTRASSVSHTRGRPTTLIRRKFGYVFNGTTLAQILSLATSSQERLIGKKIAYYFYAHKNFESYRSVNSLEQYEVLRNG